MNSPEEKIKSLYTEIIDFCIKLRDKEAEKIEDSSAEKVRLISWAITEAQSAQECAIKAILYKKPDIEHPFVPPME